MKIRIWISCMTLLLWPLWINAETLNWRGEWTQGGLIIGQAPPGARLELDGQPVPVTAEGVFVFGFHRDAAPQVQLRTIFSDGRQEAQNLAVQQREYRIQRINGLPPGKVTPPPALLERIRRENARVATARQQEIPTPYFLSGFAWPTTGRISGVYGSQRILNGQPRQPHYGVDVAAPVGAPVRAPSDGIVTLVEPDLYYSGATLIIDHGYRVSSTFLHLHEIQVRVGQKVRKGEVVATVGKSGRVTGPHLDWRMNWREARIDPTLLVPPMR